MITTNFSGKVKMIRKLSTGADGLTCEGELVTYPHLFIIRDHNGKTIASANIGDLYDGSIRLEHNGRNVYIERLGYGVVSLRV